jgi:site-specific recombinase XerC
VINRENWMDVKEYLAHYAKIGRDPYTVLRLRGLLRFLLEWADEKPFGQARSIDPAFPTYLLTARLDGREKQLSAVSMKKACEYSRRFFDWIRSEHLQRYKAVTRSWVDTIQPATSKGMQSEYHEHEYWEIGQVRKIASLEVRNITEERDRAAICFLFLSAMRAQAFVSLPIGAVDMRRRSVLQLPELGVHTKNAKAAKTHLLKIPDLLSVVEAWDATVRANGCGLWFPRIDRWHRFMGAETELVWQSRCNLLAKGMQKLCARAGIPYLSPHKLRHGHAVYMMRRVKDMKDLKSLSQNLMHSSVEITDRIYARLVSDDVAELYDEIEE